MAVLTPEQVQQYERQSYLLVSGLIPIQVVENAERILWRLLEASPHYPASWKEIASHQTFDSAELIACYTPAMLAAAVQLSGEAPEIVQAPKRAYAINVFPDPGLWRFPAPHIDHAVKAHGRKVFPRAFGIAAMTFLSDVPRHGGGPVVWPGAHQLLEGLAICEPERFTTMWALQEELMCLRLGSPIELTPRRGDVLFYSYLCVHAAGQNVSNRPRLALSAKW